MSSAHFATSDGTSLAWDELGSGETVLFLHGMDSSRRRWDPHVQALAEAGFHCVRVDLRGFGESAGAEQRFGMETYVRDLVEFSAIAKAERFHLVGHSLGGMIAQKFAVDHRARVASLVLASTTSHNGRRATAFARAMVAFAERGFDAVLADPVLKAEVESAVAEAFPKMALPLEFLRKGVEAPNPARANAWRACIEFSMKDRLSELSCPVLVLHGSADPLIPFRAGQLIHEAIEHSEWIAETGAGHSLPRERAPAFTAALLEFLQRNAARVR
jgi:pimeloyl-ACP methyl ester carboxylesterase